MGFGPVVADHGEQGDAERTGQLDRAAHRHAEAGDGERRPGRAAHRCSPEQRTLGTPCPDEHHVAAHRLEHGGAQTRLSAPVRTAVGGHEQRLVAVGVAGRGVREPQTGDARVRAGAHARHVEALAVRRGRPAGAVGGVQDLGAPSPAVHARRAAEGPPLGGAVEGDVVRAEPAYPGGHRPHRRRGGRRGRGGRRARRVPVHRGRGRAHRLRCGRSGRGAVVLVAQIHQGERGGDDGGCGDQRRDPDPPAVTRAQHRRLHLEQDALGQRRAGRGLAGLPVERGAQPPLEIVDRRGHAELLPAARSACSRSAARPRLTRLRTVPSRQPSAAPISSSGRSWK